VPADLPGSTGQGVLWQVAPGRLMFNVPGVARYLVEGGQSITMQPSPGSSEVDQVRFLRGTPLAGLMYQRGMLVFHAAAASDSGGAVLLAGDSVAGKSLLLATLVHQGWTMCADDLAAVNLDDGGTPQVWPAFPELHLWPNALAQCGFSAGTFLRQEGRRMVLAPSGPFAQGPLPLRRIHSLIRTNMRPAPSAVLKGVAGFQRLARMTFNRQIAAVLLERKVQLRITEGILRHATVSTLASPKGGWTHLDLAEQVRCSK